jgi:hypothetical protein
MNQPPRPGNESCKYQIINRPGHPSFKRRGNLYNLLISNMTLNLTAMPLKGVEVQHGQLGLGCTTKKAALARQP